MNPTRLWGRILETALFLCGLFSGFVAYFNLIGVPMAGKDIVDPHTGHISLVVSILCLLGSFATRLKRT